MPAKASKTPKASQTASKELAKAEASDPDEDRPNDDGDVMQGPSVGTSEGIAGTLLGRMFNANIIPRGICCSM